MIMKQSDFLNKIFIRQLQPSFRMIDKIIESCPKAIWAQRNIDPPIWQQIFHVLYGIDYWFSKSKDAFHAPEFGGEVNSALGEESKDFVSQEDMIDYKTYVENKAVEFINNLKEFEFTAASNLYPKWTNLDVILEQARHIQHHLGYMNRVLLKCKIKPVEWECYDV